METARSRLSEPARFVKLLGSRRAAQTFRSPREHAVKDLDLLGEDAPTSAFDDPAGLHSMSAS